MPAKERHPSEGTSSQRRLGPGPQPDSLSSQRRLGPQPDSRLRENDGAYPEGRRHSVIPAKERHPSEGTSSQRRNVIPAQERHPSAGWDQDLKQIPCHPSEGWDLNQIPAYARMTEHIQNDGAYATMTSRIDLHHRAPPPKMVS